MREMQRQKAAMDIAEAISVVQMTPPAAPQPGALAQAPLPQPAPQGALGASSPAEGPAANKTDPLQMLSSFRSPPMAAALQGGEGTKGHPALAAKPVGFAHGGFVVTRRR